jgi:hypothetical protein
MYRMREMMEKAKNISVDKIEPTAEPTFSVKSLSSPSKVYKVNAETGECNCFIGSNGRFCKHQCSVFLHFAIAFPNMPRIADDDRYKAAKVALGDKCPAKPFYTSLRNDTTDEEAPEPPVDGFAMNADEQQSTAIDLDDQEPPTATIDQAEEDAKQDFLKALKSSAQLFYNKVSVYFSSFA